MAAVADFAAPLATPPAVVAAADCRGIEYATASWSASTLSLLFTRLGEVGGPALAAIGDEELLAAWSDTIEAFRAPASAERRGLDPLLAVTAALSPTGLAAGLAAVLGGVREPHARALLARLRGGSLAAASDGPRQPALVVLAGNLPGLAVQPLLPALLLRRPVLLKSARAEPFFAPTFVAALGRRLPPLAAAVAAATWPGGDEALEAPLLADAARVLAYGDRAAVADLQRRAPGKVVDYGPKLSLAVVGADADLGAAAAGLARDVALFDQRGCLSLQVVFVEGAARAGELGAALVTALSAIAEELPPGPLDVTLAARVQQLRGEAEMRGALVGRLPLAVGSVLLAGDAPLAPSPGLRTVWVHALPHLDALPERLAGWRGLLQGAALAGSAAWTLAPALERLGISRCAPPGELQAADAAWHNGGHDPLAALA